MVDYYGNRHNEHYVYRRVSWNNWQELEEYDFITSGSIEISASLETVAAGSFEFEGLEEPDTNDLMRVYYYFIDDEGELAESVLGTFVLNIADKEYVDNIDGVKVSGTIDANSVLRILEKKQTGRPFIISEGTNSVLEAVMLIKNCGLNVDYKDTNIVITSDYIFEAGTTYLEIIKWLCDAANTTVYPDPNGTVVIKSAVEINNDSNYIMLANDDNSIMYPEVNSSHDISETPNVVRLMYNTETDCVIAEAKNESGSQVSLDVMGNREITLYEDVDDIGNTAGILETLKSMAYDRLISESADVETVTISHAYIPMYVYSPVKIDYSDMIWYGLVDSISIELATSTKTQTKVKNTQSKNLTITTDGTIFREASDEGNI